MHLDDPVSRFIPSFAKTTVVVPPPPGTSRRRWPPTAGTTPAARPITIRHLLTHTSGVSYGSGNPFEAEYRAANVSAGISPTRTSRSRRRSTAGGAADGLAARRKYVYGFNTDILGVVVEKVSGQSLADFMRARIFTPLKMTSTGFYVDPARPTGWRPCTASSARRGHREGARAGHGTGQLRRRPAPVVLGRRGTRVDRLAITRASCRCCSMAATLDGARLLSPKTVELMTSNHVGSLYSNGNLGFGLGFEITEHVGRRAARVGWRVRVGRGVPHEVLGRSRREAGGRVHDPAAAPDRIGCARDPPAVDLLVNHGDVRHRCRQGGARPASRVATLGADREEVRRRRYGGRVGLPSSSICSQRSGD